MSVMFEYENCVYVSHNDFIEKAYDGRFKLNEDLFDIVVPFKKQTLKRKRNTENHSSGFDEIIADTKYVREEYSKFYRELKKSGVLNADNMNVENITRTRELHEQLGDDLLGDQHIDTKSGMKNVKALQTSRKLYEESGNNVPANTNGGNLLQPLLADIGTSKYLFPPSCSFFCKDVNGLTGDLFEANFDLVLMDPPWWNKAVRRKNLQDNNGYKMMGNEELERMPVGELLKNGGLAVVWCTNSPQHIRACDSFFRKWGLKLAAKWFWLKVCTDGETVINFTEPPCKLPYERILIGRKNKIDVFTSDLTSDKDEIVENCDLTSGKEENVTNCDLSTDENEIGKNCDILDVEGSDGKIIVSVPSALHSHKPPLADVLRPYLKTNARCLELFARYLQSGYTSYGLEALRFQNVCLYTEISKNADEK